MKHYFYLFILILCIGCVKKNIYIIDNRGDGSSSVDSLCTVNLFISVDPNFTKGGFTLLPLQRYVTVYVFDHGGAYQGAKNYITSKEGVLSPLNGDLELITGLYDFYVISIGNKYLYPPTMQNGEATNLENGYDYLYCSILKQQIRASTTLNITMNHVCSQVTFKILSTDKSLILDSVANASISEPSSMNCLWSLYSGKISNSESLSGKYINMTVCKFLCQQVLLPLSYKDSLTLSFDVWLNKELDPREYLVKIPLLDGKLTPGFSYNYEVAFNKDSVYMYNVNINNWIDVDETGNPLFPEIDL